MFLRESPVYGEYKEDAENCKPLDFYTNKSQPLDLELFRATQFQVQGYNRPSELKHFKLN